jgi:phosphinothricin acetyltransferase
MRIVTCDRERHAAAVLDIFNEAIRNSTALYDYKPRTMEVMTAWFDAKATGGYPVIGAESEAGELMGFATYGPFRDRPAYKYTVEHSVYVETRFRRQGVGRRLLDDIIEAAIAHELHVLIGGIDAANTASLALHEQRGFTSCGTIRHAGFKFGRWLDLAFYELILPTPATPTDDR